MSAIKEKEQRAPEGWRFSIGLAFFVAGWICPLFIPLVTYASISTQTKTLVSGFLLIGAPEIFTLVSIFILGKSGFEFIKKKLFALLRRAAPSSQVSRTRYRAGLFMLLLHVVYANFTFYAPDMIPGYLENRLTMNLLADFLFLITLFVLGGDFWDKLRALTLYDARANIPESA
jgi:hypothetical protein